MRYVIIMSLAGSILFLLYLVIEKLFERWFSIADRSVFLKVILVFYLIPSAPLANFYRRLFGPKDMHSTFYELDYVVYQDMDVTLFSDDLNYLLIGGILWFAGGCSLFLYEKTRAHFRLRKICSCSELCKEGKLYEQLELLRKEYGIRRQVLLYCYPVPIPTFTVGTIRPRIFVYAGEQENVVKLVLLHELAHINRKDVLIKQLTSLAVYIHWFNPLLYFFQRRIECIAEMNCDRCVVAKLSDTDRRSYASMLLEAVKCKEKVAFSHYFSQQKNMKERIMCIMETRKYKFWKRICVCLLMAFMVFGTSCVSLANPFILEVEIGEGIDENLENATEMIFFDEGYEPESSEKGLKTVRFISEDGEVTEITSDRIITDEETSRLFCFHKYVAGTAQIHEKDASGTGCTVKNYRAEKCTKCGKVKLLELISTYTYVVCPH